MLMRFIGLILSIPFFIMSVNLVTEGRIIGALFLVIGEIFMYGSVCLDRYLDKKNEKN